MSEPEVKFVWVFDEGHRVYRTGSGATSAPIWREHWRKVPVVGETARSYVLGRPLWIFGKDVTRIPKKDPGDWVAFSEAEVDEAEFVYKNRYKIAREVELLRGRGHAGKLREIAAIVGYKQKET